MFVFPFVNVSKPSKAPIYRKRTRKITHVTGADCIVKVRVYFPEAHVLNPETLKCEYLTESTYGFQFKVKLTAEEYESGISRLEDCVRQKAKNTLQYTKLMNDVLRQEPEYREYKIEMHVPLYDSNCLDVHAYEEEVEEYVPM